MKSLWFSLLVVASLALTVAAQDTPNPDALLKSGDRVKVVLWRINGTERTGTTRGAATIVDGKLQVPVLGNVQAAGLTLDELKLVLEGRYAKQIVERHEISIAVVPPGAPTPQFKFLLPR